jgi:hypothetical protein
MTTAIVEVSCRVCPGGVIDRLPAADVAQAVTEHFTQLHPRITPVAGEHYVTLEATPACDACLALLEPLYWQHVSTPPTPAADQDDRDGLWLLCGRCHDLHAQGALGA